MGNIVTGLGMTGRVTKRGLMRKANTRIIEPDSFIKVFLFGVKMKRAIFFDSPSLIQGDKS